MLNVEAKTKEPNYAELLAISLFNREYASALEVAMPFSMSALYSEIQDIAKHGGVASPIIHTRSVYTSSSGPGDYSCAICGMGMAEPCEHWKEILSPTALTSGNNHYLMVNGFAPIPESVQLDIPTLEALAAAKVFEVKACVFEFDEVVRQYTDFRGTEAFTDSIKPAPLYEHPVYEKRIAKLETEVKTLQAEVKALSENRIYDIYCHAYDPAKVEELKNHIRDLGTTNKPESK